MKILFTMLTIFAVTAMAATPQKKTVWTLKEAQDYCFKQRQQNGHSACELPPGVVVKPKR